MSLHLTDNRMWTSWPLYWPHYSVCLCPVTYPWVIIHWWRTPLPSCKQTTPIEQYSAFFIRPPLLSRIAVCCLYSHCHTEDKYCLYRMYQLTTLAVCQNAYKQRYKCPHWRAGAMPLPPSESLNKPAVSCSCLCVSTMVWPIWAFKG